MESVFFIYIQLFSLIYYYTHFFMSNNEIVISFLSEIMSEIQEMSITMNEFLHLMKSVG